MEMSKVYDYNDYKKFLNDEIDRNAEVRGYKSLLADAAGCQRSFMSQVLNGSVHLTPDHAIGLSAFWKMDTETTEFFLDLVNHGRAATPALRAYLEKRLKETRTKKRDDTFRIKTPELSDLEHQSIYYSHWQWVAIHMYIGLRGFHSEREVAAQLHLPVETVKTALTVLQGIGLAEKTKQGWTGTKKSIHATRDSIFSWLHHDSWRSKASEDIRRRDPNSIHFTGIFTLSKADKGKIQDLAIKLMDDALKVVGPSPEEEVGCLCIDWFDV